MGYMKGCAVAAACLLCVSCGGKQQNKLQDVEKTALEAQNSVREMDQRIAAIEQRVEGVSSDMNLLMSRTYDVKNKSGRKTGLVVEPRAATPLPRATAQATSTPPLALPPTEAPTASATTATVPGGTPATVLHTMPRATVDPSIPQPPLPKTAGRTVAAPPSTGKTVQSGSAASPVESALAVATAKSSGQQTVPAKQRTVAAPATAVESSAPASPVPASADALALPPEGVKAAPPVAATQPAAPAGKGEEAAYKAALALATSGKSAAAQQKFQEFLQAYPSGRYAPNAHYWIGECLYAQQNYPEALLQFKEVTSRYPKHHKTADALLKSGMTYSRLGDKDNASLQYKALLMDFPKSEAARKVPANQR